MVRKYSSWNYRLFCRSGIYLLQYFSSSIDIIKKVCETELGIVSQCCQPRQAGKYNKQYMENVALKINVKVCS